MADVAARIVPIHPAVRALAALAPSDAWPSWQRPSDSVLAWSIAAKLALESTAAGHVVPVLRPAGVEGGIAHWRAVPAADGRLAALAGAFPPAAHALVSDEDDDTIWSADALLRAFFDAVADASVRAASRAVGGHQGSRGAPGSVSPAVAWVAALTGDDPKLELDRQDTDELARWVAPVVGQRDGSSARLCVQLHTPSGMGPHEPWPLDFHLQAADDPSLIVPAERVWSIDGGSMQVLGRSVGDPQESLVRGLAEAARL
ncbi:MAG: ATP-dependent helicase, partial [Acidimicrobiales bacterium]